MATTRQRIAANTAADPLAYLRADSVRVGSKFISEVLTELAIKRGLGVRFLHGGNDTGLWECWPGAVAEALKDKGEVGSFLRYCTDLSLLSGSDAVRGAAMALALARHNETFRKKARSVRNSRAGRSWQASIDAAATDESQFRRDIEHAAVSLTALVRADPSCGDVPAHWPINWRRGLPVPLTNGGRARGFPWPKANAKE